MFDNLPMGNLSLTLDNNDEVILLSNMVHWLFSLQLCQGLYIGEMGDVHLGPCQGTRAASHRGYTHPCVSLNDHCNKDDAGEEIPSYWTTLRKEKCT